jgi:acetyl-CoA carboxylase alpha subunit
VLLACGSDLTFLEAGRPERPSDGVLAAVGRICGISVVFVGHDRRQSRSGAVVGPVGLRKAQRAIRIAGDHGLPLVTAIDTPGAELSRAAEEGGLSLEIARSLVSIVTLESPTVSIMLGEGGGGAALSLFPADRVLAAENAWLAPIAPEGASAILWKTKDHAAALTRRQRITARELQGLEIVDRVVPEYPTAAAEKERFLERLSAAIGTELRMLISQECGERLTNRERRYRSVGSPLS